MDGASATILFLLVLIAALFVLGFWLSARARRQYETVVPLSLQRTAEIVDSAFSKLFWADTNGPGAINKRRRTPNGTGATISVRIEPAPTGTHVAAWMSHWTSRMGIVSSAGSMHAKKVIDRVEKTGA